MKKNNDKNDLFAGERRRIRINSAVWEPENFTDRIFFLESGRIGIVELIVEGSEILLEIINENTFFGESCFAREPNGRRKTLARTFCDSAVVEFRAEGFYLLMSADANILRQFTASVAERLWRSQRRISILNSRTVEKKLAEVLIFLAKTEGVKIYPPRENKTKIFVTYEELAALTAVSRQRITNSMNRFRRAGLIEYERSKPIIIDIAALEKYSESAI